MYQLRNLINRTMVPRNQQKNMKACEDFMLLLLHAHVVEAARVLQIENASNTVSELSTSIIDTFLRIPNTSNYQHVNVMMVYTHMPWTSSPWLYCGMYFMTSSRRATETGYSAIGSFCLWHSSQPTTGTMPKSVKYPCMVSLHRFRQTESTATVELVH